MSDPVRCEYQNLLDETLLGFWLMGIEKVAPTQILQPDDMGGD